MNPSILRFVIIPATLLCGLTLTRGWFEVHDPEHAKYFSVMAATFASLIVYPWLLRSYHLGLENFLRLCLWFILAVRLPISALYGIAFAEHWVVEGTTRPVRYITDLTEKWPRLSIDASPWIAFATTLVVSTVVHLVLATVAFVTTRRLLRRANANRT